MNDLPRESTTNQYGSIFHWDEPAIKISMSKEKRLFIPVTCGGCHLKRLVDYYYAITPTCSGTCNKCKRLIQGGDKNYNWKGGHINKLGYRLVAVGQFTEDEQVILSPMAKRKQNGNPGYVFEHRAVMALNLNRPLISSEIVHHKNGVRHDNRLENLQLLTTNKEHGPGHGDYYQKWQEALAEIDRLNSLLISLSTPY